jgi:hypothetical protein
MGLMLGRAGVERIAVLGRGIGGFATRRVAPVLREALTQRRPWAVVLFIGHNEVVEESLYARTPGFLRGSWARRLLLSALVTRACRWAAARSQRDPKGGPLRGLWGLPSAMALVSRPEVLPGYRARLVEMLRQARAAGAIAILCTTPVDLRFPPTTPYRKGLDADHVRRLQGAWRSWQEGDSRAAGAALEAFPSEQQTPHVRWLAGECDLKMGRVAAGLAGLRRADEANATASDDMRRIQREAAEQEGAVLVDLDGIWSRMTPEGLPPSGYFSDNHHLSLRGYRDAAFRILKALEAAGRLPAGTARPWPDTTTAGALQELGLAPGYEDIQHGLMASELSLYGDSSGLDWFHEQAIAHLRAGLAGEPKSLFPKLRVDHPAVMLDLACAYARSGFDGEARRWAGRAKNSAAAWVGIWPDDDSAWARQARRLLSGQS